MGTARGKVGEIVLSRVDGKQIARQYIATVKNPRTNGQMTQRAIAATISQMYKAGKEIFDHSFEGKSVPSGSMRAFMSKNMRYLREGIVKDQNDLRNGVYDDPEELAAASNFRVVSPRCLMPTPNAYIISEGTYKPAPVDIRGTGDPQTAQINMLEGSVTAETTVAEYLAGLNLEAGDILTICLLGSDKETMSVVSSPDSHFGYVRMVVKAPTTDTVVGKKYSQLFNITSKGVSSTFVNHVGNRTVAAGTVTTITLSEAFNQYGDFTPSAVGVICSRTDRKVRSNCQMVVIQPQDDYWSVDAGHLVTAWQFTEKNAPSSLILEGGDE